MELDIAVQNDFLWAQEKLAEFPKVVRRTMSNALNDAIKKAKEFETKAVTENYNIPKSEASKTFLKIDKSTTKTLSAKQVARGKPLDPYKYGKPTPSMPKGWKRPTYTFSIVKGQRSAIKGDFNKGFVAAVYGKKGNYYAIQQGPKTKKEFNMINKLTAKAKAGGLDLGQTGKLGFFERYKGAGFPPKNLPIKKIMTMGAPGGMISKRTDGYVQRRLTPIWQDAIARAVLDALATGKAGHPKRRVGRPTFFGPP